MFSIQMNSKERLMFIFNRRSHHRSAFTLIELLVVISIITVLAAILFPVFARAREQARKAACMSNLKQLGLGVLMYVQDNDERYPVAQLIAPPSPDIYWYTAISAYVKNDQVFTCPTAGKIARGSHGYGWNIGGTKINTNNGVGNGFGYRSTTGNWFTPSGTGPVTLAQIEQPSTTILASDPSSNGYTSNGVMARSYGTLDYMPVLHGGQVGPFDEGIVAVAPGGGGNYLFADGHVKFYNASQTFCSIMWDVDKAKAIAEASSQTCGVLRQ